MSGSTIDCALDPTVLTRLGHDLDDAAFARDLAVRFRAMLAGRVRRVVVALEGDDHAEALEAVLSLKASSGTVGALELLALAGDVERAVRAFDQGAAAMSAARLAGAAERADLALATYVAG